MTVTGTCPFYNSCLCICPCACAAAQRAQIDINDPKHAHPRYLIGYHPLWPIALTDLSLADYDDAPWSSHMRIAPAGQSSEPTSSSTEDAILCARTQIYDSMGSMTELKEAQQITKIRSMFEPCLKLGAQSPRNCKMACAYLVELENRMRIGGGTQTPSLPVRMTAVDSALSRNVNYMGVNLANRNYRKKRKIERPTISKRGCRTCRDVFREGPSVYIGHRSGSTRCPNNGNTIDVMNDACLPVIGDEVTRQLQSPPKEAVPETELADRFIAKCLPVRDDEVPGQLKSPPKEANLESELDDQFIITDKKNLLKTLCARNCG